MKARHQIDLWLFVPVFVLIIISLTTLLSINFNLFKTQLISLVIALIAYFFFSRTNINFLKQLKLPIYIISIIFLLVILFIGIESHGAIRWIDIFGIRFQFSEILKPFLSLAFAASISDNDNYSPKLFLKVILFVLPVVILIFLQPDLGSAMLYGAVTLFALIVAGFPFLWFGLLLLPAIFGSPLLWIILHPYQRARIMTFLHSDKDPLGASYNGIQAVIAVGSGTFLGKGMSEGTQSVLRFLPERHTDFIFATISEGLGFLGSALVILAFLFLSYRVYVIFRVKSGFVQ